ncbi:hypothetical protein LCGC14_2799710, partial [marine sediment metagenome]
MIKAGYAENYAMHRSEKVLSNVVVIAAIAKIDGKTAKKLDLTREGQHKKLEEVRIMALKNGNPAAAASAIREENDMLGFHREKAPNQEKEQAILDRMSEEERLLELEAVKLRTSKLANAHIKLKT